MSERVRPGGSSGGGDARCASVMDACEAAVVHCVTVQSKGRFSSEGGGLWHTFPPVLQPTAIDWLLLTGSN